MLLSKTENCPTGTLWNNTVTTTEIYLLFLMIYDNMGEMLWPENLTGGDHLGHLVIYRRIILKCILTLWHTN
jgi:hypothetical protein